MPTHRPHFPALALRVIFAVWAVLLLPSNDTLAQRVTDDDRARAGSTDNSDEQDEGATAAEIAGAIDGIGEVLVKVRQFGLGGVARPGDWAGVQAEITDTGTKVRNLAVVLASPDSDGDTALIQRRVPSSPGETIPIWLYFRVPAELAGGQAQFTIRVYESIDEPSADAGEADQAPRTTAGRELGRLVYPTRQLADLTESLQCVIGREHAGLAMFTGAATTPGSNVPITGHELFRMVGQLKAADLPDRWMGYAPYDVVVWTGGGTDEQPARLTESQAGALREWVERGGHLVVIVPTAGQAWFNTPRNPLAAILPRVRAVRREGVDLGQYRRLLTRSSEAPMPRNAVIHAFEPESAAAEFDAMPILKAPDGTTLVVRRLAGVGAVTAIGIDLTTRSLQDGPGTLQADHFWHRVLGKRQALLSRLQVDRLSSPSDGGQPAFRSTSPQHRDLDDTVALAIEKTGRAAAGVLLAFLLFLTYWVAAGPGGFVYLKIRQWKQHAWVAFLATAAVFTAVAWGGANLLRTRRVEGQHLTVLDHVYGQSNQRMRTWVNLFLPAYGDSRISVGAVDGRIQALTPWDPPTTTGRGLSRFPDARGYAVEAQHPRSIDAPSRATVRQFQADWAGSAPPSWQMPLPRTDPAQPVRLGTEIRLEQAGGTGGRWTLTGQLAHALPAPLKDVTVILVRGQSEIQRPRPDDARLWSERARGLAQVEGSAFRLPNWAPDEVLDLSQLTINGAAGETRGWQGLGLFLNELRPRATSLIQDFGEPTIDPRDLPENLLRASLLPMLGVPDPYDANQQVWLRRNITHGLDMSRWFTQPCLIIFGHLVDQECPTPFAIDGAAPEETRARIRGRTLIRWVYPLAPAPPGFARNDPTTPTLDSPNTP